VENEFLEAPIHNIAPVSVAWHKPSESESTSATELQNDTSLSISAVKGGKSEQVDDEDRDVSNYLFSRHSNSVGASTYLLRLASEAARVPEVDVAESEFNVDTRSQLTNTIGSLKTGTSERSHECDVCHRMLSSHHHLLMHKVVHIGVQTYKCETCDKSFTRRDKLQRHELIHSGEKPFKCNMCDRAFNQNSTLARHRLSHSGEKPFTCDVCNKAFCDRKALVLHKWIHAGNKPFTCEICNKGFADSSRLRTHKQFHHNDDRPFTCYVCHKAFKQGNTLRKHTRIHFRHSSLTCELCNKTFTSQINLMMHSKIHTSLCDSMVPTMDIGGVKMESDRDQLLLSSGMRADIARRELSIEGVQNIGESECNTSPYDQLTSKSGTIFCSEFT